MAISLNIAGSVKVLNPFPLDYWRGPWADVASAKAGVPLGARFDGLTVKIVGDGEYWWLQADLTDTGLIAKGSSFTFSSGLTESGGTVTLGGTLTGNATFTGAHNFVVGNPTRANYVRFYATNDIELNSSTGVIDLNASIVSSYGLFRAIQTSTRAGVNISDVIFSGTPSTLNDGDLWNSFGNIYLKSNGFSGRIATYEAPNSWTNTNTFTGDSVYPGLNVGDITPSAFTDADVWYEGHQFKGYRNGVTKNFIMSGDAATTVTTNANLTGHITSTGNATVLGSFTVAQLSTAISDANISGTNTGDQTITLTGDVTGSGTSSFATTIASGAVDLAMLSATGTPSGTTYLRGDYTWATPTGGITNGAAANELMMSNGTNAVSSGIFSTTPGDLILGFGSGGASRKLSADGSGGNVDLIFQNKGGGSLFQFNTTSGNAILTPAGSATSFVLQGVGTTPTTIISSSSTNNGLYVTSSTASSGDIDLYPAANSSYFLRLSGSSPTAGNAGNAIIRGGSGGTGNGNAGGVNIYGGTPNGSGAVGNINIALSSDKLGFFGVTAVVKQSLVTTAQGIADVLTAYGLLPSSTISGGGGITNSAANTELMMSNGTNAIASGLFATAASGSLTFGTGLTGALRTLTANGSATDVGFRFEAKGAGVFEIPSILSLGYSTLSGDRTLQAISSDTNSTIGIIPKGAGVIQLISDEVYLGNTAKSGATRTLLATGSATNVGMILSTKGTGLIQGNGQFAVVETASLGAALFVTHIGSGSISSPMNQFGVFANSSGLSVTQTRLSAGTGNFNITAATGHASTTTGASLVFTAGGGHTSGNTNAGHIYLMYGVKNGSGLDGNIGLLTNSVANWQSMERGVYLGNRLTAPTAGLANGVALFAEDSNSSSELYVTAETGAKVNISGLFEPVTESGTSFTLNETHRNKVVICSNSGVVTVTVGSGKAAGWNCMLVATHATGTITLSASGTTINGTTVTTTQFETLSLVHYGSENYLSKLG